MINSSVSILGSVGKHGRNGTADVSTVQERLNALMGNSRTRLAVDGKSGPKTCGAIGDFQRNVCGFNWPDQRVDPVGKTILAMNDPASASKWQRMSIWRPGDDDKTDDGGDTPKTGEDLVEDAMKRVRKALSLNPVEDHNCRMLLKAMLTSNFGIKDFSSAISTASNVHQFADIALDVVSILKSSGASFQAGGMISTAQAASWHLGVVFGFVGPFLQFYSFVQQLSYVMNTDLRIYQSLGLAFGVTYWAHGGMKPFKSRQFLDNMEYLYGSPPTDDELQTHWTRGVNAAIKGMDKSILDASRKGGVCDPNAAKKMKKVIQLMNKTTLTRATLKSIAAKLRSDGKINEANALASWQNKIVYGG